MKQKRSIPLETRQALILEYCRLAVRAAYRYRFIPDYEDLVSEGIIGLIKAVDSFDNERNTGLAGYAQVLIRHEMADFLRRQSRYETIPLEGTAEKRLNEPGRQTCFCDGRRDPAAAAEESEKRQKPSAFRRAASPGERRRSFPDFAENCWEPGFIRREAE